MSKLWWVLAAGVGLACSTQPSFPEGFSAGGGGAGQAGQGVGGVDDASGDGGSAGDCQLCCDPTQVAPNCENWVLCDSCASKCEPCDKTCIDGCKAGRFSDVGDLDNLNACSAAILECFAPDDSTDQCAALEPCCQHFEAVAGSDDGPFCRGFIDRGCQGACLVVRSLYARSGSCD